ncbi:MAG: NACHT domain-containing protein [Candidatus Aminicenantes bacterium]|nr:NACHT domain-containing protein [Candidatus Aminicenantes bacterium]
MVLGKPGSGKSTLLKFLVLEAVRLHLENHRASDSLLFPILGEIRKFENALSKTNRTDYNILDFLYDSMRTYYNLDLPEGFFEKYLVSGRALLLFDGLDEVAAESRRAEIRQMIASFVSGYSVGNTVIVTSRIAGYSRAQFSTTDYRHFTLEDFDDDEINAFIKNWYRSRIVNEKEAEIKANDLKAALEKKPRIKELARNPLLLTIIGIVHRDEEQLPEDRLLLYDKATEALLNTWDNVKEIIDERFKLAHRKRFLCQVAFQLQSQEKGDEAGTMIHRNDLYNILLGDFCKVFNCDNWEAQELVNDFLKIIHSRTGLLVEVGTDWFGFAHKTFQEYFAAKWIVNEQSFCKSNFQIMIDYVDKYIDNAFWQETLLLALQALPETQQALNALKHILKRDPRKIEPYFYHNHYFVMKFIAEKGEWLNDKEFVESQISDFFRFSWNEGKERSLYPNYTWERFTNWVSTVTDSLAGSNLLEKLLALAEDEKQDGRFRRDCAEAVGYLGMKDNAVVERLLVLAEDEKQGVDFRRSCAYAVGILGSKDITVLERLVHLVEDESQDGGLRSFCVCVLGELDMKDKVVEILLQLAEDEKQNGDLRRECALVLGNLGLNDKSVAERLLHLAENENLDGDSRNTFAYVVGKFMLKDKTMEERLIRIAEDGNQEGYLRRSCAYALGELGVKDKALEILLHLAEDENQTGGLRFSCAHSVGDLGMKEKTIEILLQLAEDENQTGFLRQDCAKAIGKLGMEDKAVEILLQLIEDEKQTSNLRDSCAFNVGESRIKDKNLVERLLHLVEDTKKEGDFRVCLVEAVGNSRLKDKVLAERLLHLAEDENRDGNLRRYCAYTVGHLGCKDKVVEILLHMAEDEKQDSILRSSCASTVGDLGEKDKAVEILIDLYHAKTDKYSNDAKLIYESLWKLTAG